MRWEGEGEGSINFGDQRWPRIRLIISFYYLIDSLTAFSRRGFSSPPLFSSNFSTRSRLLAFFLANFFAAVFQGNDSAITLRVGWFDNYISKAEPEEAARGWLAFCSSEPGHEGFNATRGFMRYSIKRVARHRSIKSSPGEPIGSDGKYRRLRRRDVYSARAGADIGTGSRVDSTLNTSHDRLFSFVLVDRSTFRSTKIFSVYRFRSSLSSFHNFTNFCVDNLVTVTVIKYS